MGMIRIKPSCILVISVAINMPQVDKWKIRLLRLNFGVSKTLAFHTYRELCIEISLVAKKTWSCLAG